MNESKRICFVKVKLSESEESGCSLNCAVLYPSCKETRKGTAYLGFKTSLKRNNCDRIRKMR
jgi:hypothetical protein